jgi:hypothetical protein
MNLLQNIASVYKRIVLAFSGKATPYEPNSSMSIRKRQILGADPREIPFRNSLYAAELLKFCEYSPEAATATEIISDYALSSQDGDEKGFAIVENTEKPFPVTVAIAKALQERVMGGTYLQTAIDRFIENGDCFGNLDINIKKREIVGLQFLPTWQVFRIEASDLRELDKGIANGEINSNQLMYFEQWKKPNDQSPLILHPMTVIHWRWKQKFKYGVSHYHQCLEDASRLEQAIEDLMVTSHAIGYNPNVHTMPPGADETYKKSYKQDYESRLKDGAITDIFLLAGGDVQKAGANWNPFMTNLKDNINLWRTRISMKSRIPPWLLGGELRGIRDLGGQPALSFAVFIGSVRMCLATGIKQIIDTELALKGIPKEEWEYKLVFPKIYTNPFEEFDSNKSGIEDLDG